MDKKPKISVITVCRNGISTIETTIRSIVDQTYENIEYIIIDGGSTDGTVDIIKQYAEGGSEALNHNHCIAKWISEPDHGIYDAMNKGIALASGDFINFMNGGDSFFNEDVVGMVFKDVDSDIDIIYGDAVFVYSNYKLRVRPRKLSLFDKSDPILHQSSFTKTELLKKDNFDTSFRIAADYNFFYKQYKNGKKFKYTNNILSYFDALDGVSSNAVYLRLRENLKVTGTKANFSFCLKTIKTIFKFRTRILLSKIAPKIADKLQLILLLQNPRVSKID